MKTVSINLYQFDELSSEVQAKVIEKNRYINVEHCEWYDYVLWAWKEQLQQLGFQNPEIYFSGFSSQGDGACFDADIDLATVAENMAVCSIRIEKLNALLAWADKGLIGASINFSAYAHRYSHEKTRYVSLETYCNFSTPN